MGLQRGELLRGAGDESSVSKKYFYLRRLITILQEEVKDMLGGELGFIQTSCDEPGRRRAFFLLFSNLCVAPSREGK